MITPMIGFVRGTGNSIFTLIAVVVAQYFIRIPVSLLCTRLIGFNGLAIGTILAVLSALMIYSYAILTNRWMKSKEVLRSKEMLSKCQ
jgi:Na+-driven multidrug efflux pump